MPQQRSYIYIFNDLLKAHNGAQPKYYPINLLSRPAKASPETTTTTRVDRPSISLSNVSTNSVIPGEQLTSRTTTTTSNVKSNVFSSPSPSVSASFQAGRSQSLVMTTKKTPNDNSNNTISANTKQPSNTNQTSSPNIAANKFIPPAAGKHKRATTTTTTHRQQTTFKDSAPNVSQTPTAVLGNSSSSSPSTNRKTPIKTAHTSMAKTIAEHTPNGFKTLGPGFNKNAEKSFNKNKSGSLSSSIVPSDYEHIFHAPSMITDLPGVSEHVTERKKRKAAKEG